MDTTVLLVDDHATIRKGLRLLLEEEADLIVVGEAGDGHTAIELVRELEPDVVIMDITMPDLNGIEATQQILSASPDTRVIALSIHSDPRFIENMLRAGAVGYCLKESDPEELIRAIGAVMGGQVYLGAKVTGIVVSEYVNVLSRAPADEETDLVPLRRTKLHRPRVPVRLVPRPRLLERLDAGRRRPLTLVCAPAGYGKTTLVATWLERLGGMTPPTASAWLSLDEEDNDLRVFLSHTLAAIQTVFPDAGSHTRALLQAANLPPVPVLADSLLNELDRIDRRFILVLDDAHHLQERAVLELLAELLRHPARALHLVLVTRIEPLLPVARLRARSQITEIRTAELRFTDAEVAAYLRSAIGDVVDEAMASALGERTEGWVTGLRLATLSLRRREQLDTLLAGMQGSGRYIQEYLVSEVLARQPPTIRDYLLKTSILNRFCAPLCEAVAAPAAATEAQILSGREFVDWLDKEGLFCVSLDDRRHWMRYHHLFQELLQHQLADQQDADEIASLHTRASRWLSQNGLPDEALDHALAGGDLSGAVQLVTQNRENLINTEQWDRLEGWLDRFPPEIVEGNPLLLSTRAWVSEYYSRLQEAWDLMDVVETLLLGLPPGSPTREQLWGEINAMRTEQFFIGLDGERTLACAQEAHRSLGPEAKGLIAFTKVFHALACQMTGSLDRGLEFLDLSIRDASFPQGTSYHTRMQMGLGFLCCIEGNLIRLRQAALQGLKLGESSNLHASIVIAKQLLGVVHYARNELPEIVRVLEGVCANPYQERPLYVFNCAFALALTYLAQGRSDQAWRVVDAMVAFAQESNYALELAMIRAFQVELALRQGEIAEALQRAQGVSYELLPPFWFFYEPQLTWVKLLLAQNTPESLQQAENALARFHGLVVSIHNTRFQIDTLALQALLLEARGKEQPALDALAQSLALAEPSGYIRNYVDLGPKMARLLGRLRRQGASQGYLARILAAFPQPGEAAGPTLAAPSPRPAGVEPLTPRELETLRLLATDLSTDEIATEMILSVSTVRTYAKRIYSKLEVHSRFEAVQRATELDLL